MNTIMTIVDATTEPAAVADDKADPSVRLCLCRDRACSLCVVVILLRSVGSLA